MPNIHQPQLVNLIGHSAGAVIFGIFLLLLLRDRAAVRLRASWPCITAAALAFLWNVTHSDTYSARQRWRCTSTASGNMPSCFQPKANSFGLSLRNSVFWRRKRCEISKRVWRNG